MNEFIFIPNIVTITIENKNKFLINSNSYLLLLFIRKSLKYGTGWPGTKRI